ncbi:KH domain-containing protein [bacterium]|nr:KH domain-containing protein [candidate division CSSED10-310 bacterium]
MKNLVESIIKSIVDNPSDVQVNEISGETTTIIELRVAPSDMGKVIGRQGRTAKAIRTILNAAGMRANRRMEFEIINLEDEV